MQFHVVSLAILIVLSKCRVLIGGNTPPPTEVVTSAISTEMPTVSSLTGMTMLSNKTDISYSVAIGYKEYLMDTIIVLMNTPLVNTRQIVNRDHE
jgi:hypothetical protein